MRELIWSVVRARWGVVVPAIIMLGLAAVALVRPADTAQLASHWQVAVVVIILLTAGGLAQLRVPGGRTSAPVSMATAVGTVFLGAVHGLGPFDVSLAAVCLLVVTGLLVIDFTTLLPGPLATLMLAPSGMTTVTVSVTTLTVGAAGTATTAAFVAPAAAVAGRAAKP